MAAEIRFYALLVLATSLVLAVASLFIPTLTPVLGVIALWSAVVAGPIAVGVYAVLRAVR